MHVHVLPSEFEKICSCEGILNDIKAGYAPSKLQWKDSPAFLVVAHRTVVPEFHHQVLCEQTVRQCIYNSTVTAFKIIQQNIAMAVTKH